MKNVVTIFLSLKMAALALFGGHHFIKITETKAQQKFQRQLAEQEHRLRELEALAKVDCERTETINKVTGIITQYNSDLPEKVKERLASEIYMMAIKYDNLTIDLICATITHESARSWDSTVVSHVGAIGLMQIMPATGKMLAQIEGVEWNGTARQMLSDPITNIRLGSRYLSMLLQKYTEMGFERDIAVQAALAAYNGGPKSFVVVGKTNKRLKFRFHETRKYVPYVLGLEEEFARL